ncbi:MAG: ABC transporter ATP-binding protein [Bacteroidia bacterium]
MKSLAHINKYFYKYRIRLSLGIFFIILSNYFKVYSTPYVGAAINYAKTMAMNPSASPEKLLYFGGIIILMALISGIFLFFMRQTIIVMSRLIEYDLKNEVYAHYQKLTSAFYKRNNTGDLMNRISEDVSRVRMYIGPAIMYVVNTIITFALTIHKMLSVDVTLTLYVLAPLPILVITIYYVSEAINKKSTSVQQQLSKLSTIAQESFSGIRVLKAYQREGYSKKQFEEESIVYKEKNISLVKIDASFQPFMILLIGLSTIFTIYIGGKEAIAGKITIGNIAEFVIYVNLLTWPVASLGWVTSLIQRAAASQTRINEFLHTIPEISNTTKKRSSIQGFIEFKNVHFTYPDSGITALKNVSFHTEPGKSLAIIGRTGSGKSSIANLICRMYDVSEGDILIDHQSIKQTNLSDLRNQIGYVPQEVFLFSDSIYNNIAFSVTLPQHSDAQKTAVEEAAKNAVIYSNIIEFPQQFETMVGERGITLSGGQKQRISIARALLKQAPILIFDDCLSAVDTETEEKILRNLQGIAKTKTTLIISHRVSSVKNSDLIIVLDKGEIIERGTHLELLDKRGAYYQLHLQQLLEAENVTV